MAPLLSDFSCNRRGVAFVCQVRSWTFPHSRSLVQEIEIKVYRDLQSNNKMKCKAKNRSEIYTVEIYTVGHISEPTKRLGLFGGFIL